MLQYHITKQIAAIEDSQYGCDVPVSDRLVLLNSREKGWERFRIDFKRSIPVELHASGIYDLSSGVYLLGGQGKCQIHYCVLPKRETDEVRWEAIKVERPLIDIGLALYEHDLIAVVTTTPSVSAGMHVIEIQLLHFSSGTPHPLAKSPTIHVCETEWAYPSVSIEVVGDNLVLVLQHALNPIQPDDGLHIFDWKTGTRKLEIALNYRTYFGIVVLSPDLVLLPNMRSGAFDIWAIPSTPDDARLCPLVSLDLPSLKYGFQISSLSCRCEPNPTGLAPLATRDNRILGGDQELPDAPVRIMPYRNEPLRPCAEDAIAIFNIRIQSFERPASATFSVFVHRSALLALCSLPSNDSPSPASGVPVSRSSGGTKIDSSSELETENVVQESGSGIGESNTLPTDSRIPGTASSTPMPHTRRIPWEEWGPPVCRWLSTEDLPTRWITTSAGQRAVVYSQAPIGRVVHVTEEGVTEDGVWDDSPEIEVLDFNQLNVRKLRAMQKRARERREAPETNAVDRDNFGDLEIIDFRSALLCHMFEKEVVKSSLPYASVTMNGSEAYEGILMDDERLLGLKADLEDAICGVDVFHLGCQE